MRKALFTRVQSGRRTSDRARVDKPPETTEPSAGRRKRFPETGGGGKAGNGHPRHPPANPAAVRPRVGRCGACGAGRRWGAGNRAPETSRHAAAAFHSALRGAGARCLSAGHIEYASVCLQWQFIRVNVLARAIFSPDFFGIHEKSGLTRARGAADPNGLLLRARSGGRSRAEGADGGLSAPSRLA